MYRDNKNMGPLNPTSLYNDTGSCDIELVKVAIVPQHSLSETPTIPSATTRKEIYARIPFYYTL
mgnify:FL=1